MLKIVTMLWVRKRHARFDDTGVADLDARMLADIGIRRMELVTLPTGRRIGPGSTDLF